MDRDEVRARLLALRERETVEIKTAFKVGEVPRPAWADPVIDPKPPGPIAVGEELPEGRWQFQIRRTVLGDYETGPLPFAASYEDVKVDSQGRMWAIVRKL